MYDFNKPLIYDDDIYVYYDLIMMKYDDLVIKYINNKKLNY